VRHRSQPFGISIIRFNPPASLALAVASCAQQEPKARSVIASRAAKRRFHRALFSQWPHLTLAERRDQWGGASLARDLSSDDFLADRAIPQYLLLTRDALLAGPIVLRMTYRCGSLAGRVVALLLLFTIC